MASITQEVSDKVAAALLRKGRSKLSVSEAIGMAQTTFNRKLAGNAEFTATEIFKIAREIYVPPATLLPSVFEAVA